MTEENERSIRDEANTEALRRLEGARIVDSTSYRAGFCAGAEWRDKLERPEVTALASPEVKNLVHAARMQATASQYGDESKEILDALWAAIFAFDRATSGEVNK